MLIQNSRIPVRQILLQGFLPSFLKILYYRLKGFKIGRNVSIGFGSVVCAESVSIGDNTKIGFFTIIRGKEIKIGSHVSIGSTTFLDTPYLEIGDEGKINEQVFIGGLQLHNSQFKAGKHCQIMQMSFINPSKSIVLGDEVSIGGHSLLFGHSSWLSKLEGYNVDFDDIEIGNNVALSWRVFLLPGTKIGDGSVIAPNSLVNRTVPSKCLAAGYPAKIISKFPDFPKPVSDEEKVTFLHEIVDEMFDYLDGSGLSCSKDGNSYKILQSKSFLGLVKRKTWVLSVCFRDLDWKNLAGDLIHLDVFLSLQKIPYDLRKKLSAANVVWLDIESKERAMFWNDLGDEVVLFLRRYGIRFNRFKK